MPYVANHGVRIYYEVEGEGPALVLRTGDGGDRRIWELAGYLRGLEGFRILRIDQRGRGESDRPGSVEAHRIERHVEDVAAVLDDAGIDRAAYWGYSSGIHVGVAFGAIHPGRLRAMVGTGVLRPQDLTELPALDADRFIAEDVAQHGVAADLDHYWTVEQDRFPDAIDTSIRAGDPRMHALDIVARRSWAGPRSQLDRFSAPILILSGEKEDPERATETTAAQVPRVRCVRLPGLGHLGAFYRSDAALAHARPFLDQHLA